MRAYYNENDPKNVAWLRELIANNLIAPGDVDDRDIRDVKPCDLAGYTQCHFFAGIGGWSLALRWASWPDHRPVWTGSCPCQPFSAAGRRGGFADERHLWPSFHHLVAQCRPPKLYGEQVASAADWLRLVRGDLEALDYAVGAMPIEAASAGADHLRDRFWFVGNRNGEGLAFRSIAEVERGDVRGERAPSPAAGNRGLAMADADQPERRIRDQQPARQQPEQQSDPRSRAGALPDGSREQVESAGQPRECERVEWVIGADGKARRVKSGVRLLAHGIPDRVGLLRGFGNAIDPRPAAAFILATC